MDNVAPSIRNNYIRRTIEESYDFSIFNHLTRPSFMIDNIKELIFGIIQEESYPEKQTISVSKAKKIYFISSGKVSRIFNLKQKFTKEIRKFHHFGCF